MSCHGSSRVGEELALWLWFSPSIQADINGAIEISIPCSLPCPCSCLLCPVRGGRAGALVQLQLSIPTAGWKSSLFASKEANSPGDWLASSVY